VITAEDFDNVELAGLYTPPPDDPTALDIEGIRARAKSKWQEIGVDFEALETWALEEANSDVHQYGLIGMPYALVNVVIAALATAHEFGFAVGWELGKRSSEIDDGIKRIRTEPDTEAQAAADSSGEDTSPTEGTESSES